MASGNKISATTPAGQLSSMTKHHPLPFARVPMTSGRAIGLFDQ